MLFYTKLHSGPKAPGLAPWILGPGPLGLGPGPALLGIEGGYGGRERGAGIGVQRGKV